MASGSAIGRREERNGRVPLQWAPGYAGLVGAPALSSRAVRSECSPNEVTHRRRTARAT
jgi:hypothetical protein